MNPSTQPADSTNHTDAKGIKTWYRNGQLHREDGRAVEYIDSYKA